MVILNHSSNIKFITSKFFPAIVSIQKSHLRLHYSYSHRDYKCYTSNFQGGERACGGTTLLTNNNTALQNFASRILTLKGMESQLKQPNFIRHPQRYVTFIFLHIKTFQSTNELNFQKTSIPIYSFRRFQRPQPNLGSLSCINRGNTINKFLAEHNSVLLNTGQQTNINISNGKLSVIDFTISSFSITHLF